MNAKPTMQSILQHTLAQYQQHHRLSGEQIHVCHHLLACQTEALGGEQWGCDQCTYQRAQYHSCRNRHCPQCQWRATRIWRDKQQAQVLPVSYFHVVFTLPHEINGWVALHSEVIYRCFFAAVWGTLNAFGQNPKRLGGQLGALAVLHTWGQNLSRHVHIHCLIPGGVLDQAGQWRAVKGQRDYLFPNRALSRHVRGKMVSLLRHAAKQGELNRISHPGEIDTRLTSLMCSEWVVYTKPYLRNPEVIVDYLARYTYRIALDNRRLLGVDGEEVKLSYKDYRDGGKRKVMTLSAEELIRRFLLHVLPKGFMRLRHYGFLANRCRERKLAQIRESLKQPAANEEDGTQTDSTATYQPNRVCPQCQQGTLRVIQSYTSPFSRRH